ncbi:SDR family oxidoreductase [Ruminococcaceae bacterium OttesenSCG-928-I18]|nr:SDR family oxidoreductase [Ruminococcaceae bacterium OttesenSCG-928-I18]
MKALITGASSGIGREMAHILAAQGWELILVARRKDKLDEVKKSLGGGKAQVHTADLSRKKDCLELYQKYRDEDIDLLVCNAGFGLYGDFTETELQREIEMIGTNVTAVHILTKLFLRDFVRRDSGRILITASAAGFFPGPGMAAYYAGKHYVVCLAESLYEELRRRRSKASVSVLCPGPVKTEFSSVAGVHFLLKPMTPRAVAAKGIQGALHGRLHIVPGLTLKAAVFGRRFLSEKLQARLAWYIQQQDR